MSYARVTNTGTYIWSDGKNMNFLQAKVPESEIDIFLYKLYNNHPDEFKTRLERGKELIENYKIKSEEYLKDE